MAELLIRAAVPDRAVLDRLVSRPGGPGLARVVLDAHVEPDRALPGRLRLRGIPLLIDPQTYYLQDDQHDADPWANLPFAEPAKLRPADLLAVGRVDRLVEECLQFQADRGATALICPYAHIESLDDGWAEVQSMIWRRARRFLDRDDLGYRVVVPFALSWSLLRRPALSAVACVVGDALRDLQPDEIALAASKVDQGTHSPDRLGDLVAAINRLQRIAPVIAWQQGSLGEAAVAAGAIGYETGIGWRERCELRAAATAHRRKPTPEPHIGARPTYIDALMRSLPRATLVAIGSLNSLSAELTCLPGGCCPEGRSALSRDGREHTVLARARSLDRLSNTDTLRWRWSGLERRAEEALKLASRINAFVVRTPGLHRVDTRALEAISVVAHVQKGAAAAHAA